MKMILIKGNIDDTVKTINKMREWKTLGEFIAFQRTIQEDINKWKLEDVCR